MRRFPLAFAIVGVLGLLTGGAAVVGALSAPTGADVTVHNGASQTLAADQVAGNYRASDLQGAVISFAYTAPDRATEVARNSKGVVKGRRSISGQKATSLLGPVRQLLSEGHFSAHGSSLYVSTTPAATLVPSDQRAQVSGDLVTTVRVENGYVVGVLLVISATEGSQRVSERVDYRLTRVGPWRG